MTQRRLTLVMGPIEPIAARLRNLTKGYAKTLEKAGIFAPEWNHVRLYAACADPAEISMLRHQRGLDNPLTQQMLTPEFNELLTRDLAETQAKHVIFCASQLGALLTQETEVQHLKSILAPHFDRIELVAHVAEQAVVLVNAYSIAVQQGRQVSLKQELSLVDKPDWWAQALALRTSPMPEFGVFNDIQAPPFWLDYTALITLWEGVFGAGSLQLRPLDIPGAFGSEGSQELGRLLGLSQDLPSAPPSAPPNPEAAAALARMRQLNDVVIRYCQVKDIEIAREYWQGLRHTVRVPGPAIDPAELHQISSYFASDNKDLIKRFPDLEMALRAPTPAADWAEADPTRGFRATQYLAAFAYGIRKNSVPCAERRAQKDSALASSQKFDTLLASEEDDADKDARSRLLTRVKVNHQMILGTQFRPHNTLGSINEETLAAAFAPVPMRTLPPGNTGNVVVGCMKNEAPYIIEWIAYHRAIGVDNFLIYTNDCSDGTDEILGRLQQMGIIQHRNNDKWKGNSPQQCALNKSLKEPLIQNAEWIAHIDVDEFMNVRTGDGTLSALFAAVPDATNIAMTWRLFGHNGVTELNDAFVIDQFDSCAPKYCPKPHTVWGFKTLFRNIGAYAKISCHRPNKLNEGFENKVKWVNGSGQDMTRDAVKNGWRSSKSNIGYDLLQLNHYALRSAESFLIKRQRGRALHVDRSIGINYWIRMDWSDFRDVTIKRNLPRLHAEYDRLMQDTHLARAHHEGLAWHKAKATELRAQPEFQDLYRQALGVKLNETERVAYALSLDMES